MPTETHVYKQISLFSKYTQPIHPYFDIPSQTNCLQRHLAHSLETPAYGPQSATSQAEESTVATKGEASLYREKEARESKTNIDLIPLDFTTVIVQGARMLPYKYRAKPTLYVGVRTPE